MLTGGRQRGRGFIPAAARCRSGLRYNVVDCKSKKEITGTVDIYPSLRDFVTDIKAYCPYENLTAT
jgi:hypothetical protein